MDDKWQGQENATNIGAPPHGMWYDPSVKESAIEAPLAAALRYFLANPEELGLPTHVDERKQLVYFDNGNAHSFHEVIGSYEHLTADKDASFFDGPVDLGKEHDGDFPSVTWMPRGHEDQDVNDHALTADRGVPLSVFNAQTAPAVLEQLKANIKAPYVNGTVSTLGGEEHVAIMLTIGLDPKESWPHGYIENSNYGKFYIDNDGTIEQHSGSMRFRKTNSKSVEDMINKINRGITPKAPPAGTTPTASLDKVSETNLNPDLLQKAIESYVKTSPDINWIERYAERYVDYVQSEAEEHGKRLHSNVIDRLLEEVEEEDIMELFFDTEVESWQSTLEGINTEEALQETYPQILQEYYKVKPKPEIGLTYSSALEAPVSEEQKTQIAAKWGPEYLSALAHFHEAIKNKHPHDRALQYAVSEMKKQNVTIQPTILSEVADIYK